MDHRVEHPDHRIDSPCDSTAEPRRAANGTTASSSHGTGPLTSSSIEQKPAGASDQAITVASAAGDDCERVSAILRACAFAIIFFQIGYVVLDGGEYPRTFATSLPFHIANMILGLIAFATTLSPRAMRSWRGVSLAICSSILASSAWIAMLNGDNNVLIASIVLFYFGAGALIPWGPPWQAALEATGALSLLGYSMQSADSPSALAIDWMLLLSAALLSQLSAVHSARYRSKLAEQLSELVENHRLLTNVMELREQAARAREFEIVEIKRAESRLRNSHAALRKILHATLDVIVVSRVSDGTYIDFNDQFGQSGYTPDDLNNARTQSPGMFKSAEQQRALRELVLSEGVVRNVEVEFLSPDGGTTPTMLSAVRVELDGEDCVVTMIRDLTAAKEASRKLEENTKAVRDIFDVSPDAISVTRVSDGKYVAFNEEFLRLGGYTREQAMGSSDTELKVWTDPGDRERFTRALTLSGIVRNLDFEFLTWNRTRVATLISATMINLGSDRCVVAYIRDITAMKQTERELVAAREAALAASRTKSEFLSSMSHEIRTPMNAILGMADLLAETELGDEQRRYVNTLIGNGNALLELINGILDLAKVESGRISLEAVEFDPREVTEKVVETLAIRAHEKGLELIARFAPEVPGVAIGDPLRLGQILINLVGNAIKFTQKGQVLVSVEPDQNSTTAGGLKFAVTDSGIGIPADQLHLLFHPFTQADSSTSRKYGGSGLGLAIVSRLVALMHGKVEVTSRLGTGSRFSFTAQFGTAGSPPALSASHERAFAGIGIMLVDDNADSRSVLSEMLRAHGAMVTELSSGTEALAELRRPGSQGSRFQMMLLDGRMPVVGGFDIAEQLMTGDPERPQIVMMLSTDDLTGKLGRLRALGVDNYVVKPVRRADLFAALARARAKIQVELRVQPHGDMLASPAIAPLPASSPALDRPLRILMADDSRDNRALIEAYLKKTPYLLEEAEDGQQALDKFIAGRFDLILMDIQMPNVDGYEATERIRGWERANGRRRTPVVALTASALEDAADRTRAAGCDMHVTKPVKKSTLLDAIRSAVDVNPSNDDRADPANREEEICPTE